MLIPLGLVSNCWRTQLADGIDLDELIAEASGRGLRTIELRQGSLGRYEDPTTHLPDAEALAALPKRFPEVRFNMAVSVPFMNPWMTTSADDEADFDPVFLAGKWAAAAVAGNAPPHLRLVDLLTVDEQLEDVTAELVGESLSALTRAMAELDGILSVENARQPWRLLCDALAEGRRRLGVDAHRLRLCYDPCNLLAAEPERDATAITASLDPTTCSMVHAKQRRDGRGYPAVADGELDWAAQLAAIARIGYDGPLLFEVEPHKRFSEYLAGSIEYLRRASLDTEIDLTTTP